MTTSRVGFGGVPDAREGYKHCAKRGRLGLGGLCRRPWDERREEKCSPARFSETENARRLPGYNAAIV